MRAMFLASCFGGVLASAGTSLPVANPAPSTCAQDPGDDEASRPADEEPEAADVERGRIERLIELASTGRAVVRPQAAQRLVDFGAAAVSMLRERVGEDGEHLESLGPDLVEVLADFGDEDLRKRLWWQLDEPEFAWRPQATRSLSRSAVEGERARFQRLLTDHLAQVRTAAVQAMAKLGEEPAEEGRASATQALLRTRLADDDGATRRAAAATLHDWGDTQAAFWLLEELKREDRFFDLRTGERARYEAAKLLQERLEDLAGFDPAQEPGELQARLAWRRLEEQLLAANGGVRPELPDVARARSGRIDAVIGLELRSCRHGDLYLRWTTNDELFVGTGRSARVALPEGTTRTLLAGTADRIGQLGDERFWGASGCDTEQLHWKPSSEERTALFLVSKGPQPIPDLRPAPLTDVARALLASLPDGAHDDPRLADLRRRATAALAAIGGPTGSR